MTAQRPGPDVNDADVDIMGSTLRAAIAARGAVTGPDRKVHRKDQPEEDDRKKVREDACRHSLAPPE